jgi:hypothetical protein
LETVAACGGLMKSPQGWKRPFDDPLPRGRPLVTLEDAAGYIMKLPKAEQDLDEWQVAVESLLLVVKLKGPTMMARIGMLRALNHTSCGSLIPRARTRIGDGGSWRGPVTL